MTQTPILTSDPACADRPAPCPPADAPAGGAQPGQSARQIISDGQPDQVNNRTISSRNGRFRHLAVRGLIVDRPAKGRNGGSWHITELGYWAVRSES